MTAKVKYIKTTIKQVVKQLDPKPEQPVVYQFSNGRVFREKRK